MARQRSHSIEFKRQEPYQMLSASSITMPIPITSTASSYRIMIEPVSALYTHPATRIPK
jgi:hypothetical protein